MRIFISYRRAEDKESNIVFIIHDKLSETFGKENVFRDTWDITAGTNWRERLDREVNTCKVMLVVIGPDWATVTDSDGNKRLFNEMDVTRWEVETGLNRRKDGNLTLIPVLVQGAKLPRKEELPLSLQGLSEIQTITLRNDLDLDGDIDKLIRDIRRSKGYAQDEFSINKAFEPETVYIFESSFLLGSPEASGFPAYESPQRDVFLPAYRIGKYPVSNAQYEIFVRDTRRQVPPAMGWDGQRVPQGLEDHPVTGVTWYEALAYCQWLRELTKRSYTLPNEAQWEKACRGGDNFLYPWGNEPEPGRSNQGCDTLADVKAFPAQNEFGLHDLVGNVRQWTATLWGETRTRPDDRYAYPWEDDGRNDLGANSQIRRVLRGSSMRDSIPAMRCSARSSSAPEDRGAAGFRPGFRVMLEIEATE